MKSTLANILKQAVKPSRFRVMTGKVASRVFERISKTSHQDNLRWIESNVESYESYASKVDQALWLESKEVGEIIATRAEKVLSEIEHDLGGGAIHTFLYFIARYIQPNNVVETGVAAGFSSYSILQALEKNDHGELFSSDFPYFRLPNPEKYIGIIVPDNLRKNWTLLVEGDEKNLPIIIGKVESIDLVHYDSDKSYKGRKNALAMISNKLSANAIILMDDIQDNLHFHDMVKDMNREDWHIFEFKGKHVGMIGKLA